MANPSRRPRAYILNKHYRQFNGKAKEWEVKMSSQFSEDALVGQPAIVPITANTTTKLEAVRRET